MCSFNGRDAFLSSKTNGCCSLSKSIKTLSDNSLNDFANYLGYDYRIGVLIINLFVYTKGLISPDPSRKMTTSPSDKSITVVGCSPK